MATKKAKTFNSQVYSIACNRLKLKRREKIIFFRLLGFLIRNDKPFPYSVKSLSDLTGYKRRSIFECMNALEHLRLITRIGYTTGVRYTKGIILIRICSLVQNRINRLQINNCPLVQKLHETASASAETAYKKTSSSLKRKDKDYFYNSDYQEYVGQMKSDILIGIKSSDFKIKSYEEWI
jgi:hypothetical protein